VADRFHILKNLGEALEELLSRLYQELLQIPAEPPVAQVALAPPEPGASPQDSETTVVATPEEVVPAATIAPAKQVAPARPTRTRRQPPQRTVELTEHCIEI
jgi:hypothetical protein